MLSCVTGLLKISGAGMIIEYDLFTIAHAISRLTLLPAAKYVSR